MASRAKLIGVAMAALMTLFGLLGCATRHHGPRTEHFNGRVFSNPAPPPDLGFLDFLRWQVLERGNPWPKHVVGHRDRPPMHVSGDELRISFVGHATVLVQVAGMNILTDPLWSKRASPFTFAGPSRVREPGIAFEDLPPIDVVLVSHNHYDHLDTDTLTRLWQRDKPLIVTPLGNLVTMQSGDSSLQAIELDWGSSISKDSLHITAEPMQHWSARGPFDQNLSLWAAFVLQTPVGTIYFAGDTGYGDGEHFKSVGDKYGSLRLAILPIGAYEPRWFVGYAHMNPEEAVQAAIDLRADHVLGHHWATFRLTNEPIDEPAERFRKAVGESGVSADRFRTLEPGKTWDVPVGSAAAASPVRTTTMTLDVKTDEAL